MKKSSCSLRDCRPCAVDHNIIHRPCGNLSEGLQTCNNREKKEFRESSPLNILSLDSNRQGEYIFSIIFN